MDRDSLFQLKLVKGYVISVSDTSIEKLYLAIYIEKLSKFCPMTFRTSDLEDVTATCAEKYFLIKLWRYKKFLQPEP